MAKLAQVLLLILIISVYSNDTIDFLRCFYKQAVPNIELIFNLVDAIKAQNWIQVIGLVSKIYTKGKDIAALCKEQQLSIA